MPSRSQGFLVGCLLGVAGFMGILFFGVILFWSFAGGTPVWTSGDAVGLVEIRGPIYRSRYIVEEIEAHRNDPSIRAVVIRIDSPGGAVAPSQEIHDAVERLRESKPVVASMGATAASGGYYVAVAADSILANPGTLTGSIGVIFEFPTLEELFKKIGVNYHVYKSGDLKDVGSFARNPNEEDEQLLDEIVADVYEQFVDAVAKGRGMTRQEVLALADGRVFSGQQAMHADLVDGMGDLYMAQRMAAQMAGISGDPVIVEKREEVGPLLRALDWLTESSSKIQQSQGGIAYRFLQQTP